jgi:hypothetical protein
MSRGEIVCDSVKVCSMVDTITVLPPVVSPARASR